MFKISQEVENSSPKILKIHHESKPEIVSQKQIQPIKKRITRFLVRLVPKDQEMFKGKKNPKMKSAIIEKTISQNGRWTKEEHERFIDAIINFGNDWKKVQKYVSTRTSTQARSHAQKFLLKLKQCDYLRQKKINLNQSWAKTIQYIKREFSNEELSKLLRSVYTKNDNDNDIVNGFINEDSNTEISSSTEDEGLKNRYNNNFNNLRERKFSENATLANFNFNFYKYNFDEKEENYDHFNDNEYIKNFDDNFFIKSDFELDKNDFQMLFLNNQNSNNSSSSADDVNMQQ